MLSPAMLPTPGSQPVSESPPKKKRGRPPKQPQPPAQPTQYMQPVQQQPQPMQINSAPQQPVQTQYVQQSPAAGQVPMASPQQVPRPAPQQTADPQPPAGSNLGGKSRGRPPGSKNKFAKTTPPLIPHVMTIKPGEDIVERLKALSRQQTRSLVVLAASGLVLSATLMQKGVDMQDMAVELTHPDHHPFTILSISGAVLYNGDSSVPDTPAVAGSAQTNGGLTMFLSASLAQPNGGVMGGQVAGPMRAASPITLVIGHWFSDNDAKPEVLDMLPQAQAATKPTPPPAAQPSQQPAAHQPAAAAAPITQPVRTQVPVIMPPAVSQQPMTPAMPQVAPGHVPAGPGMLAGAAPRPAQVPQGPGAAPRPVGLPQVPNPQQVHIQHGQMYQAVQQQQQQQQQQPWGTQQQSALQALQNLNRDM